MSGRVSDEQRSAAVLAVHSRLKREQVAGSVTDLSLVAHSAVAAMIAKGWTPPATRGPAVPAAKLAAEVARLRAGVDAVLALHPFRFIDPDDPERTPGDPVLWLSEVEAALAGVS